MGQFWKMEAVWILPSTEETNSEPVLLRFEQFVMLLRCPEKKREYADVVQLYLHQCWAEVVHDAPYSVAVRSKEGQMPLGV
ncbi:Phthiocerol/phthiodiolone dimycocerosyl transferase [Trichinella pseudospiralis]